MISVSDRDILSKDKIRSIRVLACVENSVHEEIQGE